MRRAREPMRLLYLITRAHEGGAQAHVLTLIRGLVDQFEITLASGEHGYLTEGAAQLGVPVHIVEDLVTPISPLRDWRAAGRIRELISQVRPDLLHTHSFKAGMLGRLAARTSGIPAMFTAHGWAFADGVSAARKAFAIPSEWLLARASAGIITVSEADYRLGLRYRIGRPPKMNKVLNGVEPLALPARARPVPSVPRVVMVARFDRPKEQSLLVRAMAAVEQPYELWLVGDGRLREAVEAEARTLGVGSRVRFLGTCRNVPEILAEADIFVLASRSEGLPMSILEAMRAGLPVVATNVGGVPEAVQSQVTGFLVARGDAAGLRRRIVDLLEQPALRARMGQAGRTRFEREFSSQVMVEGTRSVYERLIPEALAVQARGVYLGKGAAQNVLE